MSFNFPAKSYDKVANNFFLEIYSRFWEASKNLPRMHVYVWIRMRMNLQPDQERNDWLDHLKNSSDMLLSNAEHFVLYKVRRAIHITPVVLATKTLICLTWLGSRRMHSPCLRGQKPLKSFRLFSPRCFSSERQAWWHNRTVGQQRNLLILDRYFIIFRVGPNGP